MLNGPCAIAWSGGSTRTKFKHGLIYMGELLEYLHDINQSSIDVRVLNVTTCTKSYQYILLQRKIIWQKCCYKKCDNNNFPEND